MTCEGARVYKRKTHTSFETEGWGVSLFKRLRLTPGKNSRPSKRRLRPKLRPWYSVSSDSSRTAAPTSVRLQRSTAAGHAHRRRRCNPRPVNSVKNPPRTSAPPSTAAKTGICSILSPRLNKNAAKPKRPSPPPRLNNPEVTIKPTSTRVAVLAKRGWGDVTFTVNASLCSGAELETCRYRTGSGHIRTRDNR